MAYRSQLWTWQPVDLPIDLATLRWKEFEAVRSQAHG
jgi:hypothetical protein